jgi:ABC-type dipeptide/oligopeptide/nickel transport system permease subunit
MVGAIVFVFFCLVAVVGWTPYDPEHGDFDNLRTGPSLQHPMGTDNIGRDMLSRIILGGRVSLRVGVMAIAISATAGVILGLVAGYYGGWTDSIIMRIIEIVLALPGLLLALLLVAYLGPSLTNAMLAIAIVFIPPYARVVRANTLSLREMEYVTAARAIGARDLRVMFRAILPNTMSPIIVQISLLLSVAILVEAALSFLGLGVQPPTPAWGSMMAESQQYIDLAWWMPTFPGLTIFVTVIALNFIGDGLREALDPRQRRR